MNKPYKITKLDTPKDVSLLDDIISKIYLYMVDITDSQTIKGVKTFFNNIIASANVYISGNLGVGTTGPGEKLTVSGNIIATGNISGSTGSKIYPTAGVSDVYMTESYGLELHGATGRPVQLPDSSLLVGYDAIGGNYGTGNLFVYGNVGIGIASSGAKLEIASGADTTVRIGRTTDNIHYNGISLNQDLSTTGLIGIVGGGDNNLYVQSNATILFRNGTTTRAYIDSSGNLAATGNLTISGTGNSSIAGNVGIGTATPGARLEVNGRVKDQSGFITPVGALIPYAGSSAPAGWLLCDGSAVSRSTYAELFAVCGETYGAGNGVTTFNLPDMRGVFPKGAGTTDRAAGKDANGNAYTVTLGTYSQDKMQGHLHNLTNGTNPLTTNSLFSAGGDVAAQNGAPGSNKLVLSTPVTDGTNGTPRTGLTTEPQSLGLNFIIKY
jgi:microcystin-dependent protein